MYNTQVPDRAALPTASRLFRSTLVAAVVAGVLLITVVMPAEYGVDPTGVGSALGLKAMGEAKLALAKEAKETPPNPAMASASTPATSASTAITTGAAPAAQSPAASPTTPTGPDGTARSDEKSYLLKPGQGIEVKLAMLQGAKVEYSWEATDGVVNFDAHGDSDSKPVVSHSYKKGTATAADKGILEAKFSGTHGWYWRNRGQANVVVTLRTKGAYSAIDRVL